MSENIYLLTILLVLGTIVLVFGMRFYAVAYRVRVEVASADAYRDLADKSVSAESRNATSLSTLQTQLADLNVRLSGIEKILKEVE